MKFYILLILLKAKTKKNYQLKANENAKIIIKKQKKKQKNNN